MCDVKELEERLRFTAEIRNRLSEIVREDDKETRFRLLSVAMVRLEGWEELLKRRINLLNKDEGL